MAHGGRRAGAGRKAGVSWKPLPIDLRALAKVHSSEVIGTQKDPLGFLIGVAADQDQDIQVRLSAASVALPYLYPRLAHATVDSRMTVTKVNGADLLERLEARLARVAGPMLEAAAEPEPEPPSPMALDAA